MDEFTLKVIGALVVIIGAVYTVLQFWERLTAKFARKSDVDAITERIGAQDKLLEDRRKDVIELHGKIDTKADSLSEKMDDLRDHMDKKLDRIVDVLMGQKQ